MTAKDVRPKKRHHHGSAGCAPYQNFWRSTRIPDGLQSSGSGCGPSSHHCRTRQPDGSLRRQGGGRCRNVTSDGISAIALYHACSAHPAALKIRQVPRDVETCIAEAAQLLDIQPLLDRKPKSALRWSTTARRHGSRHRAGNPNCSSSMNRFSHLGCATVHPDADRVEKTAAAPAGDHDLCHLMTRLEAINRRPHHW